MRSRYVYQGSEVVYAEEGGEVTVNRLGEAADPGYYVMPDISPYQSMADGSMITSRSHHREHLKRHHLIEIGNEKMTPRADLRNNGAKEALVGAIQQAKHKYGSRFVEGQISDALNKANEMKRR